MTTKWRLYLGITMAAALLLPAGCSKKTGAGAGAKADKLTVALAPIQMQDVQREINAVGTLYGEEEATISAKVSGRVLKIDKDLGDKVAAGEALAEIDPVDYELQLTQKETAYQSALAKLGLENIPGPDFDPNGVPTVSKARSQMDNAFARMNRGKQLFEQTPPLMSAQDYSDLETAYRVAKGSLDVELLTVKSLLAEARSRRSEIDAAKQKVADAVVRAPTAANYVVGARMVSAGEYVKEGDRMFRVVANNPMKYRAQVPERYMSQTQVGQSVEIGVTARPEVFSGVITRISPQVDVATRMYQVEATVDNAAGLLTSGSFARGRILVRKDTNVRFVPMDAVVTFVGATKVFAVQGGKAVEIPVETGVRQGNFIEVRGQLDGIEEVVTTGATRLSDGMPVTARSVSPETPIAPAEPNR